MNVYEGIVIGAVLVGLVVLFGVVFYQNWVERNRRLESAATIQERLEQLNRKRDT